MEHAEIFADTPRVAPRRRVGTWVLSPTQMGFLLGCVGIGLILTFGAGFIAGMWYQASDYITPYPERPITVAESPPQVESQDLTFYSTLTKPASPTAPITAPGAEKTLLRTAGQRGTGAPVSMLKATERPLETVESMPGTAARTAPLPKAAERSPEPVRPPVATEVTAVVPPPATTAAAKTPAASYSVQVGSFRYRDQAERLLKRLAQKGYQGVVHPTPIPGKGVWYRVQVGGSADRSTADRLAQRLSTQERLSSIVVDGSW